LGKAPEWIMVKDVESANDWQCYHVGAGNTHYVSLNQTIAATDNDTRWNDTTPDANFITLGSGGHVNGPNGPYIAYAWTGIEGYSKFGTYVGNGNDDGAFIYLGFKPAFFMMKTSSAAGGHWLMYDNKRNTTNPTQGTIAAQAATAENTGTENAVDFLSNGVKCRDNTDNNINHSGVTYVYIAFAEMPFKYATAR